MEKMINLPLGENTVSAEALVRLLTCGALKVENNKIKVSEAGVYKLRESEIDE